MDFGRYGKAGSEALFTKGQLQAVMDQRMANLKTEVETIPQDRFLNTSSDDLAKYLADKYSLEPIVLHEVQGTIEQRETKIDVSGDPSRRFFHDQHRGPIVVNGTRLDLHIPFSGDGALFSYQPDHWLSGGASGSVKDNALILFQDVEIPDPDAVNRCFEQSLQFIRTMLGYSSNMISWFNGQLSGKALNLVNARRERLLKANNMVAGLNFPVRKRTGESDTYVVPTVRKRVVPVLPSAPGGAFTPDPTIEMSVYEDILRSLQSMSLVMERSPTPFKEMNEEGIRTHFLLSLNAAYEGEATGETFNGKGKTDILVRHQDQNVFIGECKIWKGAKHFGEAVDQLMGYVTWRDTKAAILVFNRGRDTSKVLAAIQELLPEHPRFKRMGTPTTHGNLRVILGQERDPNREVIVEILLFDVPA